MNTIQVLGQQHQDVLAELAAVSARLDRHDGACDLSGFVAYLEGDVLHHFAVEEQALFPILARYLGQGQGPLAVMNAEHISIRELLRNLGAAVRSNDAGGQRTYATELIALLEAHIAKEDQVLFPMASRLLSPEEQAEVDACGAALGTRAVPLGA
jgi:hemerythrin-like domain-containing protein